MFTGQLSALHAERGLVSTVPRSRRFVPSAEEPTCHMASSPAPIPTLKSPHLQLTDWAGLLFIFASGPSARPQALGFVNTQFCSFQCVPTSKSL